MDRDQGWQVIDEQRIGLANLLEDLSPAEWATASLCTGWTVRDVGAHMVIAATTPLGEVMAAAVKARFGFDRMIYQTAVDRARRRSTPEIAADLRGIVGSRKLAPTTFWRDPLTDLLVHTQDVARPLGRRVPMPTEAAHVAAEWAWRRGFPFWPARRLAGVRLIADDVEWQRGRGEELHGPIASLLLLSTGRMSALADVTGPGLRVLAHQ